MTTWTANELTRIAGAEELELAPRRPDGTLRNPTTIWVVRHEDDLYVRAYRGRESTWFRGAKERHEGHIRAGGVDRDVVFVEADDNINDALDRAYRTKYGRYAATYVDPMVGPAARAATLRLVPRSRKG